MCGLLQAEISKSQAFTMDLRLPARIVVLKCCLAMFGYYDNAA